MLVELENPSSDALVALILVYWSIYPAVWRALYSQTRASDSHSLQLANCCDEGGVENRTHYPCRHQMQFRFP
jgi:hypothetical protein